MNDRAVGLLDYYDIEVLHTRKGRGAILCDTNKGCLILKEYTGNPERIKVQNRLLKQILETDAVPIEQILKTKEEELLVEDLDGKRYILKTGNVIFMIWKNVKKQLKLWQSFIK